MADIGRIAGGLGALSIASPCPVATSRPRLGIPQSRRSSARYSGKSASQRFLKENRAYRINFQRISFLKFRKFSIVIQLLSVNRRTKIYYSPKLQLFAKINK
jgi:hypothetical protein